MSDGYYWHDVVVGAPMDTCVIDAAIDTEVLIAEIRTREALWNMFNEDFKDRNKKEEAWQEVFNALNDGYGGLSDSNKKLYGKYIQGKWKNIKDTYRKYRHSIHAKPGNTVKRKKKYVYEEYLRFLDDQQPAVNKTDNDSLHNVDPVPEDVSQTETDIMFSRPLPAKRPKRVTVEDKVIQYLEDKGNQRTESTSDEHQSFFNSLLSIVRRFDEDEVLEFRASVIRIAQDIRRRRR